MGLDMARCRQRVVQAPTARAGAAGGRTGANSALERVGAGAAVAGAASSQPPSSGACASNRSPGWPSSVAPRASRLAARAPARRHGLPQARAALGNARCWECLAEHEHLTP